MKITDLIPQRPPFLFIDEIISFEKHGILMASLTLSGKEDFFTGHFPTRPVMPGVLLQEAAFQSGAAYMALLHNHTAPKIGVVARVSNAKFKNLVEPPAKIIIETRLTDEVDSAAYFNSKITLNNKLCLAIDFTVYSL